MAIIMIEAFRSTASDEEFLAADKRMQSDFAYQQPGLMRRTTARGAPGEWLVMTSWYSADHANAAEARRADDPVAIEFDRLVDAPSRRTAQYEMLE